MVSQILLADEKPRVIYMRVCQSHKAEVAAPAPEARVAFCCLVIDSQCGEELWSLRPQLTSRDSSPPLSQ